MSDFNLKIPVQGGKLLTSIGIETLGGIFTPIINVGETLPNETIKVFSTAEDNQSAVTIRVFIGTEKNIGDPKNTVVGDLNLDNIPPAPRGTPQIEVIFKINESGFLTVSARERGNGNSHEITFQGIEVSELGSGHEAHSSGTCFLINSGGMVLTNSHVVGTNKLMTVIRKGEEYSAKLIARDDSNDLAILKTEIRNKSYFPLSASDAKRLEEITAIGFGFGKTVSADVKATRGIVSALAGIGNNYSQFQIDASIQVGNSGGPVIDKNNSVVGIAVAKLDTETTYKESGTIAENVNFAIKISTAKQFLDSNDIIYTIDDKVFDITDINKIIDSSVLYIHD